MAAVAAETMGKMQGFWFGDTPYVRAKNVQLVSKDPNKAIALFWVAINAEDRVDSALKKLLAKLLLQLDAEFAFARPCRVSPMGYNHKLEEFSSPKDVSNGVKVNEDWTSDIVVWQCLRRISLFSICFSNNTLLIQYYCFLLDILFLGL